MPLGILSLVSSHEDSHPLRDAMKTSKYEVPVLKLHAGMRVRSDHAESVWIFAVKIQAGPYRVSSSNESIQMQRYVLSLDIAPSLYSYTCVCLATDTQCESHCHTPTSACSLDVPFPMCVCDACKLHRGRANICVELAHPFP